MNKQEILEKSRQSNKDEGVEFAKLLGGRAGEFAAFTLVGFPLLVFSVITGQFSTIMALATLSLAFESGRSFITYHFTKQRRKLILAVVCAVGMAFFAFMFVSLVLDLGWWR